jgi:putative transcriptional regulator
MSVTHRLGDEWIAAYAAGSLSEGRSLFVAAHLAFLPDARRMVATAEAIGGALLEELPPESMAPDALASTLARLDETVALAPGKPHAPARSAILPAPLQNWLGCDVDDLKWGPLGPGMRKAILWRGGHGERLWMLRAKPGIRIPRHGHNGIELTLVLSGSLTDQRGTFRRGDVEEMDSKDLHGLNVGPEEECICLAITEGPVRFEGLIARLIQPFIGL